MLCLFAPFGRSRPKSVSHTLRPLSLHALLLALVSCAWPKAASAAPFAYIPSPCNGSVNVIDTETNAVVATIPVGNSPNSAAVNPAGTRVYVTNGTDPTVWVIDATSNTVTAKIDVGNAPFTSWISQTGTRLYVSTNIGKTIAVIDTASNAVFATIVGLPGPNWLADNPAGTRLYAENGAPSSTLSVIDTSTNAVVATVPLNGSFGAAGVVVDPSGARVYAGGSDSQLIHVLDAATNTVVAEVSVPGRPGNLALTPDGTKLYVGLGFNADSVAVIDTATNTVVATVPFASDVQGVAMTPDGRQVFVDLLFENHVAVINTATNTIANTINVPCPASVSTQFIGPSPRISLREQAAALARTLLTAPYGYGGKGYDLKSNSYVNASAIFGNYHYNVFNCSTGAKEGLLSAKGVDCSGLVMWSFNTAFGATKDFDDDDNPIQYQTANGQYLNNTGDVSEAALKPGDLLFFNYAHESDPTTGKPKVADHVAMYVGGDDVVEAYTCDPKYPTGNFVIPSGLSTRASRDPITNQQLDKCKPGATSPCFVGFRTVTSPAKKLGIYPLSPITLAVTDPDGFTIGADTLSFTDREVLREVADVLYYTDSDAVISPVLKAGAYLLQVLPKSGTSPTDTYGLVVKAAGSTLTLADNVPISKIPSLGYGLESTGSAVISFIPVAIEIKPDDFPNPINLKSQGNIPVGILSSPSFNALSEVDANSLTFGRTGSEQSLSFCDLGGEDVNGDGLPDLVCHFYSQKTGFQVDDTQGILKGRTNGGELIRGTNSVVVVP